MQVLKLTFKLRTIMIKKYIAIILVTLSITGCNYLSFDEGTGQTKEYSYAYFDELARNVTYIYAQMQSDFGVLGGALREAATDNAVYTWETSNVYDIYNNTWSPLNTIDNGWPYYYSAIRASNVFLENFSLNAYDRLKDTPSYKDDIAKAANYPYEVRFLRAYFYFELAKRYGDIPLLTSTYSIDEINKVKEAPFDTIVNFIVKECDSIAPYLPVTYRNFYQETGRITRGAAMALKSRVLLYAASPLHNPDNRKDKWERAAIAAGDFIKYADTGAYYSLVSTENLFANGNSMLTAKELILERRNDNSNDFEAKNLPIGFIGVNPGSGNTPTQNLIDAFEMKTGVPFDWNNPINAANPYMNRDPRLAKMIIYNGSTVSAYNGTTVAPITVETFIGGKNAAPMVGATLSGYYLKKYIDQTVSLNPASPVKKPHHYVLFRYAEIILNYAEALNEAYGPDYTDATFTVSSRDALNRIRSFAKMPPVYDGSSTEDLRPRIRNERRIELAFEDHRFWDIRRWKIGNVVTQINGIKITKTNGVYTYKVEEILPKRIWDDKMYLYPIPQSELYKNSNLTQNPRW